MSARVGHEIVAQLIDAATAAKKLAVPLGTLRSWVSRKQIPHVRLSARCAKFDEAELDAWIASRRVAVGGAR